MRTHLFLSRRAFTLVELLVVIAIIGILAALTFGALGGIAEKNQINRTRADLTMLKVGLERYRVDFGDYPRVGGSGGTEAASEQLLLSLAGYANPNGELLDPEEVKSAYINLADLNLSFATVEAREAFLASPSAAGLDGIYIRDSWDAPVLYFYDRIASTSTWRNPSFILYSHGPDGVSAPPEALAGNGVVRAMDLTSGDDTNLDNVLPQ